MSIVLEGVTRSYDRRPVLRGVDLEVPPGQMAGLEGPNGAGKSTLLRIIATHARPGAGTVHVAGIDAVAAPEEARRHIGYVPHEPALYGDLTPLEHLRFWARLHRMAADPHGVLLEAGLADQAQQRCRALSRGQRQRLAITLALLPRPDVLLLDEPFTGLDPAGAEWLALRLRAASQAGAAVLAVLHDPAQADALQARRLRLHRGRMEEA